MTNFIPFCAHILSFAPPPPLFTIGPRLLAVHLISPRVTCRSDRRAPRLERVREPGRLREMG
eukprot:1312855-Amphidinium_carterae.1